MIYKGRCNQCVDHFCKADQCKCDCHKEYEKKMKKLAEDKKNG